MAYELIKPINLYWMWFSKTISSRMAGALMKCVPILLIVPFLPGGLNLNGPASIEAFLLFATTLFIGMFIISAIINLFYISIFYTMTSKGITSIFYALLEFFGGRFNSSCSYAKYMAEGLLFITI